MPRHVAILVHTTGKTWYNVLYQHTIYVMGIYQVSIVAWAINRITDYSVLSRLVVIVVCTQQARPDTVLLKQKKRSVLDITGFFFRMSTQVKAEGRSTKAFTWVRMQKKKPVISNTGNFFCYEFFFLCLMNLSIINTYQECTHECMFITEGIIVQRIN